MHTLVTLAVSAALASGQYPIGTPSEGIATRDAVIIPIGLHSSVADAVSEAVGSAVSGASSSGSMGSGNGNGNGNTGSFNGNNNTGNNNGNNNSGNNNRNNNSGNNNGNNNSGNNNGNNNSGNNNGNNNSTSDNGNNNSTDNNGNGTRAAPSTPDTKSNSGGSKSGQKITAKPKGKTVGDGGQKADAIRSKREQFLERRTKTCRRLSFLGMTVSRTCN